jgi:hypothetical protein
MRHELSFSGIWSWVIEVRRDTFGIRGAHDWFIPGIHYQAPQETEQHSESGCFARGLERRTWKGLKNLRGSDMVLLWPAGDDWHMKWLYIIKARVIERLLEGVIPRL